MTAPATERMVAGVLGAVGNNGKGVVGVAWQMQMMACKCLNSSGNGSDFDGDHLH